MFRIFTHRLSQSLRDTSFHARCVFPCICILYFFYIKWDSFSYNFLGTTATFRAYGLICIVVLGAFVFINFYRKDTGFVSELPQTEDPRQVAEATHLAPHGVPSNAIPRALSSTRLHELANQDTSYGATYQSGDTLNVPGANGGEISASLFVIEIRNWEAF